MQVSHVTRRVFATKNVELLPYPLSVLHPPRRFLNNHFSEHSSAHPTILNLFNYLGVKMFQCTFENDYLPVLIDHYHH